jgi:hypothetical protein
VALVPYKKNMLRIQKFQRPLEKIQSNYESCEFIIEDENVNQIDIHQSKYSNKQN